MALEADRLSFSYGEAPVLSCASFGLPQGGFAALIGPNGAGKSTLLKLLLGELSPSSGAVRLLGQDTARFRNWRRLGYVPQDEPTSGMDLQSGENFYRLLAGLNRDHGLTILMVSHDVDRICSYVSTLYCLEEGTLAELTPGQVRRERAGLHRHSDMTREGRGERSVHL